MNKLLRCLAKDVEAEERNRRVRLVVDCILISSGLASGIACVCLKLSEMFVIVVMGTSEYAKASYAFHSERKK